MASALLDLPRSIRLPLSIALAAIAACWAIPQGDLRAEDFRVETKVFVGENETPESETTTLFVGGDVYDFLKSPAQSAVFRRPNGKNAGRFILLNDNKQISTEFSTGQLKQTIDRVQTWASRQADPFLKFAANPDFEESFESKKGELVLASHMETYKVSTEPATRFKAAAQYREFLDWYAQLNTLLSGGPPPQPRLQLNDAIARHKVIPTTVELTRAGEKEPLRAEHEFTWRLSKDDMKRIDKVQSSMAGYRKVDNEEFVQTTAALNAK